MIDFELKGMEMCWTPGSGSASSPETRELRVGSLRPPRTEWSRSFDWFCGLGDEVLCLHFGLSLFVRS